MDDLKESIIKKLSRKEIRYDDINIPAQLREDKDVAIAALNSYDGRICKYLGEQLKKNKEFAKQVFKMKYGYALEYFSDDIKNDFECCKVSIVEGFSGYRYIGNDMKMNKELGLMEINNCHGIKEINKELRKDKDIIEAYWNSVDRKPNTNYLCSIISIDDFGNEIIDKFLNIENKRHIQERKEIYEEQTETVQFVKYQNQKFNKKLFKKNWNPFVIIIGNKKNNVAEDVINYYNDDEDNIVINIIEIYKEDVKTSNIKLIAKNKEDIFNLLRFITYTTAGDTFLTEDNLGDIIEWLYVNKFSNKNIEILKFKIDINEPTLKIDKTLFKGKFYIFQIVSNEVNSDFSSYNYIWTIVKQLKDNNIDYEIHLHDSCNINDIEIYALKVR